MEDEFGARLAKVERLRARGEDPYPVRFDRTHTLDEVREHWDDQIDPGASTDDRVRIAGRVMLKRTQGRLVFANVRDGSGELQLFVSQGELGADAFARFGDEIDRGDWVGVEGKVMKTKVGELSVNVSSFILLAKALRPLPEKWHGLSDTDTRYRQRYVDLIANDDARRVFDVRFAAIDAIRRFLADRGFVEVETPVLHAIPGGAAARPFATHHNALDVDLYLRVAPELYLKRLVVGGYDKVFELARVFRNEGLSTRHNPEFTMLELYEAFADYFDMMRLTEELIADAARHATGGTTVEWDGAKIDLTPPFERRTMVDLVREHAGVDVHPSQPVEALRAACDALNVPWEPSWRSGKLVLEIYEKTTEANILEPTFVCDYPRDVSPLARTHRDDPTLTERFELIVHGRELANAFSELNDPVEQLRRFEAQASLKQLGDEEAHGIDVDYVRALEFGLPPTGGMGLGVDRLVMLLAGVTSIREVILFPHLRPEAERS
ncbi:MAG: lysyl-tRNA synthetase, class [Actinomycetota bacterium]|jgi:lysyl-tRNA synthetase class 2|nr:lysyl-tRNA synthetase, class [Actinomycetota bacterium]